MDQSRAPFLDAVAAYHRDDRYGFTPPGHRRGRGADPRARAILGTDTYRSDMLASAGLDDRSSSHKYLSTAEQLMADAVDADQAFFSTAGSSLSVKAAMLAVAGGKGQLLVSRDALTSWTPSAPVSPRAWPYPTPPTEPSKPFASAPADTRPALQIYQAGTAVNTAENFAVLPRAEPRTSPDAGPGGGSDQFRE
jgi:arginine decarboxylase